MKPIELILFWILFIPILLVILTTFWIEKLLNMNTVNNPNNVHNKPMGGE